MMARLIIIVLLGAVIMMTMAPLGAGIPGDQTPEAVAEWLEKVNQEKPKLIKLRFYLQNNFTGNETTVVQVAQANITATSPTSFGQVLVVDGSLTETPDVNSKEIGRAQGITTYASKEDMAFMEVVNYVFTDGNYNGSTLQLIGRGPTADPKQFSIVGGTGALTFARGTAFNKILATDAASETVEVNFMFFEY